MKDLHAAEWEELARREPYFRVLTHDGGTVATDAFFETGEADIAALLAAIASVLGRQPSLTSSLDFGCGAGRITIPLARRSTKTVACDIAPTMLVHAARNVQNAGLNNVTFIGVDELNDWPAEQFDFICSLLVLQYIPPSSGYAIIRALLKVLAPGGLAALHVVFEAPGVSPRTRFLSRVARRQARPAAFTETNVYDEHAVRRHIEAAGAHLIGRFATKNEDAIGAVLIIQKA